MALPLEGHVGLWYVRTNELTDPRTLAAVSGLLTADERKKHQAFRFDKHKHEYLVTRALERAVLASCLGRPATELAFERNDYGRPELVPASPLRFNLTNTVFMIACAVATGRELGVDAEPLDRADDVLGIAETVFTPYEIAMLDALSLPARRRRAIELWTLKEAYMKARGMGMSIPVQEFEMRFAGTEPSGLRVFGSIVDDPTRWVLLTREVGDHLVSLCVERRSSEIVVDIQQADIAAMLGV